MSIKKKNARAAAVKKRGGGFIFPLFLVSLAFLSADLLIFKGSDDFIAAEPAGSPDSGRIVLLAFTSEQCPACQALDPLVTGFEKKNYPIKRLSPQNSADVPLYRQFQIETIPSFVLLVDGRETDRFLSKGEGIGVVQERLLSMFQTAGKLAASSPSAAPNRSAAVSSLNPDPQPGESFPKNGASMISNEAPTGNGNIAPVGFIAPSEKGPIASTVRLRVTDGGNEIDSGTGTLIHANESNQSREGLILTCGHLFRESGGKSPVTVDLYNPIDGKMTTVSGECVFYDDDLDIGFVGIPLPFPMEPAKLVPPGYLPKNGDSAVSVGCSSGENPSVWEHSIVSTDKKFYQPKDTNSKNHPFYFIEVSNAPRPGRSGGGLFVRSESGESYLIGVCNAGDAETDEGYFLPASVVYDQLFANRNLAFVYEDILRAQGDVNVTGSSAASFDSGGSAEAPGRLNELQTVPFSPYEQAPGDLSSAIHPANGGTDANDIRPAHFEERKIGNLSGNMEGPDSVPNKNGPPTDNASNSVAGSDPLHAGLEELRRCHHQGAEIICIINWPKTSDTASKESDVIRLSQPE